MTSWHRLHDGFVLYGHCDDGTIAEGFSDKVELLLIERWWTLSDFAAASLADPQFEFFVLRHVNSLMSRDNGQILITNAEQNCPEEASQLCTKLAERVAELHGEVDRAKADSVAKP